MKGSEIRISRLRDLGGLYIWVCFMLVFQSAAASKIFAADEDVVTIKTGWSQDAGRPGDSITLAVAVAIKKGFHINADARQVQSSEDFKPYPTRLGVVAAPEGLTIETPHYPTAKPIKVDYAEGGLMSFEDRAIIYLALRLADEVKPGELNLKLEFEFQACAANYCLFPQKIPLEKTLQVVSADAAVSEINRDLFRDFNAESREVTNQGVQFDLFGWTFSINVSSGMGLLLLLITAAFGGMLLNFTPCVLPLIPIKIISLSHAADNRRQCAALGLSMSLGVVAFWLVLGVVIALASGFTATNQLFQYPLFPIAVGVIIAIMATGMFGAFSMRLPNFVYLLNPAQDSLYGSFGLGILAAILSTPCTAPFMGAAAAWAASQPPITTMSTFCAIGIGMALPYLLLSAWPALVDKMPKTGAGSELIKQVMGLFMLAAAAYFIGVGLDVMMSSPPEPSSRIYWWPVMAFCAAAGAWLAYRTLQIASSMKIKSIFSGLGILLIVLSIWGGIHLTDKGPFSWVYYTPQRFETALTEKKVVVMVFTAEWCLNCRALEQGVLDDPKIVGLFANENIIPMKVDITGNNPAGKAKLKEAGSLTIPLLVVYAPDGRPVFKSDFYTVQQVLKAVDKAHEHSIFNRK